MGGLAVLSNRRFFSIILVILMIFSSMGVFADNNGKGKVSMEDMDLSGLKWVEEPSFGEFKNKKFEVHGKLEIPKEFKGTTIVKLEVNGFNVVPMKDGSFSKSIFINSEVHIKVFVGKDEVKDLAKTLVYLEDSTNVDKVIALIDALPDMEDLKLSDKESVEEARLAYENLTDSEKKAVTNLDKLIAALEKIEHLEEEAQDKYFFPTIYMNVPEPMGIFNYSNIHFEGYVTNVKYLDKILVDNNEADLEYLEYAEVKNLAGNIVYRGSAYKFNITLELEDKAHAIYVEAVSQSGQRGGFARRFWVDTTAPELNITVKDREVTSDTAELEINMKDMFGYLRLYEFDSHIYLYDRNYSYPVDETMTWSVSLDIGENVFPYTLVDGAGNKTTKEITIIREEDNQPYIEKVIYQKTNHPNPHQYSLYGVKNLPGDHYRLYAKTKTGEVIEPEFTTATPITSWARWTTLKVAPEDIVNFDVGIYTKDKYNKYTEVLKMTNIPFYYDN